MKKVIGITFRKAGKIYYFNQPNETVNINDSFIVETAKGIEYGKVVITDKQIDETTLSSPLKDIIRIATDEDKNIYLENKEKEKEAFKICLEKISKQNLPMKLIDVEILFDHNKILFYFTAEGRIDFRELVKSLASIFHTRIEMRQIGVRDETRLLSGVGVCGRCLCCANHLTEFQSVSINMAKEQNLSLNPTKISGICGRLMCCLKYEDETYSELNKKMPNVGDEIKTPDGIGEVLFVNTIKQLVKAIVKKDDNAKDPNKEPIKEVKLYSKDEIEIIKRKSCSCESCPKGNSGFDLSEDLAEENKDESIF